MFVDHQYPVSKEAFPRNGLVSSNQSPWKCVLPTRSLAMGLHVTIQKLKHENYNFACSFVCMLSLGSDIKGIKETEVISGQGFEEII
jgi:hypothetical protein